VIYITNSIRYNYLPVSLIVWFTLRYSSMRLLLSVSDLQCWYNCEFAKWSYLITTTTIKLVDKYDKYGYSFWVHCIILIMSISKLRCPTEDWFQYRFPLKNHFWKMALSRKYASKNSIPIVREYPSFEASSSPQGYL